MEANNSYCGVGIAFNARIGGEENNAASQTVGGSALWVYDSGQDYDMAFSKTTNNFF